MLDGYSLALSGVGLVLATAALALLERLYRCGFWRAPKLDPDPTPLRKAAERAYDYAREKQLPLAAVAEGKSGSGDAVGWFENHLLRTVPLSAASPTTGTVSAKDFRAYLHWMRTVW